MVDIENGSGYLFTAESAKGRAAYKLYASSVLAGILLIWFYRATHIPLEGRWAWLGLFGAEIWFGFYWFVTQSARWNPIYYRTHKDKLSQRFGAQLPKVDIFVCTADPFAEPPSLVMSTILSLMAYDYEPEKLSIYLSDDAGSILTFYALWEASCFAKHWLPYCKKFKMEPRSPMAYFSTPCKDNNNSNYNEWSSMKKLFEDMTSRIERVVSLGKIPEEFKEQKRVSKWNAEMTSRNHRPIVQIMIDGRDQTATDLDGNPLPTLVYVAREKHPQHHHNFKAGAMNALIRVSSEISNAPIILNVDCDMYSNNSASIKDALCFFLDKRSHDVAYVQYPQFFHNITKNDLYANSLNVIGMVEISGFDIWGGPAYVGTGCFHRRESLCGKKYSGDYNEDWIRSEEIKHQENTSTLEGRAESLITCIYENNTLWGKEVGLKYGFPVEDIITGLTIQCKGWRSICHNPSRKGFLGMAPTTLEQTLVQHKRWGEGNFQISLSKHCPIIQGHGKIKLGLQFAYSIYGLWAPNSLPTFYYLIVPPLCLLKGISLFPKVSSPWFTTFAYVIVAKNTYAAAESLLCGDTFSGWWNSQRMWVYKRLTSYLYGVSDTIIKLLGFSKSSFTITSKVADGDESKRYENEVMEFGSSSPMFRIIATIAVLNLGCLLGGVMRLLVYEGVARLNDYFAQLILCGSMVAINVPVYGAMFFRKDKGRIPPSITFASLCLAMATCLVQIV
ncbi:cellulose synthase-like protein E6 isoform X2 [Asparagus officinalis]|uniref:cellulose synthase-like protein E6 isoform X2 n=1 Tax=Asparagus officinalis TaxID=4686 RepID=UPI00098E111C|nr:cellulose synthase-like protein E6 isoform X2 [Asparagus officinalis]